MVSSITGASIHITTSADYRGSIGSQVVIVTLACDRDHTRVVTVDLSSKKGRREWRPCLGDPNLIPRPETPLTSAAAAVLAAAEAFAAVAVAVAALAVAAGRRSDPAPSALPDLRR